MRKLLTLILLAIATVATAQTFVGYMSFRSSWCDEGGNNPRCGWYSYNLATGEITQHTNDESTIRACKGGTSAEGHLYAMETATDSWMFPDPRLHIYDAETYKLQHTTSYGRSDRDHATKDFALNPADHQLYAIAQYRDGNTADGGWLQHYDLSDGTMTRIAHLPTYQHALAIDGAGNFYTLDEGGTLYRVTWSEDKMRDFTDYGRYPEAVLTAIGNSGYRLQSDITYANSLAFDYRSGRLFWSASAYPKGTAGEGTDVIVRGLFELSTTDGSAQLLSEYPDNIILTALAISYLGLDAPDDIQDLAVTPQEAGSPLIAMALTTPAVTYGQQPLPADSRLRVHPVIDGRDYYAALKEAGMIGSDATLSEDLFLAAPGERWVGGPFRLSSDGYHTLGAFVELVDDGRRSQESDTTLWVGFDQPLTPEASLTYNRERTEATIRWSPVTRGIHGGDIDTKTLRYIVTRRANNGSDETDIAFGVTPEADGEGLLSVTDAIDVPMSYTRYGVTVLTDNGMSDEGRTPYAVIGQPRPLPFTSTFSYIGEFHQFITIDANGDGWDDWETPSWYFDDVYGAAFCYLNRNYEAQDDWLVTPALDLVAGEEYDIIFQSYGYYGKASAPCHLQIALGAYAEPDALSRVVYDNEYSVPIPEAFPYAAEDVLTESITVTANPGDRYIGFHNITDAFDHMSLDNIFIRHHNDDEGILTPLAPRATTNSYDLYGRPVAHSNHGITIQGGRKVVHDKGSR